ncbi:hypothetical protein CEXT_461411 [Caerostris extrusa]|uniref:Secreted protein n=1 Tax=Caerostris extrusa TaxID=172846 RepID=A0AAV4XPD5_CAEEX|nr:hypothetical protein CEXT_461411 [Caerostris extrusa]
MQWLVFSPIGLYLSGNILNCHDFNFCSNGQLSPKSHLAPPKKKKNVCKRKTGHFVLAHIKKESIKSDSRNKSEPYRTVQWKRKTKITISNSSKHKQKDHDSTRNKESSAFVREVVGEEEKNITRYIGKQ